ncbi:MAG: tRNA (adenosine(37)-N6)-threonylcarbamoyltransferase complex ATPase subunit type 1 TsaE [Candidatus Peribacteraceae bacterium]|jgi:tRNA threonylcarbamoyladenosine biosynthesis protein TsaE|nr:tRNA (adenosine(37)-N6)-threonylcarbamoyltransferase complex ATPase subunit type 1 TsaE [Candidatus Peribacteraceae bacterium]HCI03308.1 tRNA (adenosine(37)-N6)-threonylcarbamoyltransferase complex ATPase subunit type 1 TsaE [Candidatus Peribacteria bacterium]|tara:strand:+ start:335 stop:1357 length:1023 start_codon:yes stop_codon:yes gene_type:complete
MSSTTPDKVSIRLSDAKTTESAGRSLAYSIYQTPLTISLIGELGAGKTTFLQGFAEGLGISERLTSPTYALEQRYQTKRFGELLHIDLYRIEPSEAASIIESSDDHDGIRCIEWADRIGGFEANIEIRIIEHPEDRDARTLECTFKDIPIPSRSEVEKWRKEVRLPPNVIAHCDAVADIAQKVGEELIKIGKLVRPTTLRRCSELHDLFRFVEFHRGNHAPIPTTKEDKETWATLIIKYEEHSHESACAEFLREQGFPDMASIVEIHGLKTENHPEMTIEQKILFYADKRIRDNEWVTVDERFEYFKRIYTDGKETDFHKKWHKETKELEEELFDGPPSF